MSFIQDVLDRINRLKNYYNSFIFPILLNTNFIKLGTKRVIANPQLENNTAVQNIFDYYPARPYMTRRCYLKAL